MWPATRGVAGCASGANLVDAALDWAAREAGWLTTVVVGWQLPHCRLRFLTERSIDAAANQQRLHLVTRATDNELVSHVKKHQRFAVLLHEGDFGNEIFGEAHDAAPSSIFGTLFLPNLSDICKKHMKFI